MNYYLFIIVFIVVLFIYLHIYFQLKTSCDLEVFDIEKPSKDILEEICDFKQPTTFKYNNVELLEKCNINKLMEKFNMFDMNIRNLKNKDEQNIYIPLGLNDIQELLINDNENNYITENNYEFLNETNVLSVYKMNDLFLRPLMVSSCNYDFWTGSKGSNTPLRYFDNFRNYIYITQGEVTIRLIPPNYKKYLYSNTDYLNYEFISPINPWNVDKEYERDYMKVKSLDITIKKGEILYIPAYWWFSLKYDKISSVCVFKYKTYMNILSVLPTLFTHYLQQTNIKVENIKKNPNINIKDNIE